MIALTGATGFVGGRLLERLREDGRDVRCLTRRPESLQGCDAVRADVLDPGTLAPALAGVEVAYYLVHALGDPGSFDETEAQGARNFAEAARDASVQRIVYLGGLAHGDDLSDHMRSRQEVGRILGSTDVELVELRASIVIGAGSLSFDLLRELVDGLPVLALPPSLDASCQPIAVDDLVQYLVEAAGVPPGVYEIGGADVLTYRDLLSAYADETGAGRIQLRVPGLPAPLPGAVTDRLPQRARAALKLVESLGADSTVRTPARAFGVTPLGVREAIRLTLAA